MSSYLSRLMQFVYLVSLLIACSNDHEQLVVCGKVYPVVGLVWMATFDLTSLYNCIEIGVFFL